MQASIKTLPPPPSARTASPRPLQAHLQITPNTPLAVPPPLLDISQLQADIKTTSSKYAAVQAFKAYLADLADCLATKVRLLQ
jgi:hypothetical protein